MTKKHTLPKLMCNAISDSPVYRKFLDISSAHIMQEDCKILQRCHKESKHIEGFFVYDLDPDPGIIVVLQTEIEQYSARRDMLDEGLSLAFVDLLDYCRENNLTGLWIDPDAPRYNGPPEFEW